MKTQFFALGLFALLSLPMAACSAADTTDTGQDATGSDSDSADLSGKADGTTKPIGTYELTSGSTPMGQGQLALLVLETDGTVHGMYAPPCKTCMPAKIDATYSLTKSTTSSRRYIKIHLDTGSIRYEYKLSSGKLSLRKDTSNVWFKMAKAKDAWCGAPSDCEVQNLPQPKCPGEWSCTDQSVCQYSECQQQNPCEAAGGACVPLVPDACEFGTVGDAKQYSCGGGLGVMCCLPPAPAGACKTDADCRVEADYCTGCDCRALASDEQLPACSGPGVKCFADPCGGKQAACVSGQCVVE